MNRQALAHEVGKLALPLSEAASQVAKTLIPKVPLVATVENPSLDGIFSAEQSNTSDFSDIDLNSSEFSLETDGQNPGFDSQPPVTPIPIAPQPPISSSTAPPPPSLPSTPLFIPPPEKPSRPTKWLSWAEATVVALIFIAGGYFLHHSGPSGKELAQEQSNLQANSQQLASVNQQLNNLTDKVNSLEMNGGGIQQLDAYNITTGTLNDKRLSSNVYLLNQDQTISGNKVYNGDSIFNDETYINDSLLIQPTGSDAHPATLFRVQDLQGNNLLAVNASNKTVTVNGLNASASNFSSINVSGTAKVGGNTSLSSNLTVGGNTTLDKTLSVGGNTSLAGTLNVSGATSVNGATTLNNTLNVVGATTLNNTLETGGIATFDNIVNVTGTTNLSSNLNVAGNSDLSGTLTVNGATAIGSTLNVTGATVLSSTLQAGASTLDSLLVNNNASVGGTLGVTGATTLSNNLSVGGNTSLSGTLGVTGAVSLSNTLNVAGDFSVNTNKFTVTAANGNVTAAGTLGVNGDLSVNTNKFVVTAANGNTSIAGTLGVTGNTTLNGTLAVVGATQLSSATLSGTLTGNGTGNTLADLTVTGNTDLQGNVTIGSTSTNTLSVNGSIETNLVPANNQIYSLGSPAYYWKDAYIQNVHASNIFAGSTTIDSTTSTSFTLDSANSTNDTQDQSLVFYRGTAAPNAILGWDSTNKQFTFNFPVNAGSNSITGGAFNSTSLADSGNATVGGTLGVTGATTLGSTLNVTGATVLSSTLQAGSSTLDSLTVTNNATVGGTLGVTGATTLSNNLSVGGNTTLSGTLGVTGAASFSNTLGVAGDLSVNTNKFTVSALTGNVTAAGTLGVTGDLSVNTNKFTVTAASGNTSIAGTLNVTGATTLGNTLSVASDLSVNGSKFTVSALTGNTSIAGTLGVTGDSTLSGALNVTGSTTLGSLVHAVGAVTLDSSLSEAGDFNINAGKFTVTAASGNTSIAGTLNVAGATTLSSTLQAGASTLSSLAVTNNASVGGNLTVTGTLSSGSTTLSSLAVTGNETVGGTLGVTGNITVGNGSNPSTITFVGGGTASRPASPTKGQLYFDTSTSQLLQYNGSKWISDRSTATEIVAAGNSGQVEKDSADFVGDGTNDQNAINSAIAALPSTGGSVVLLDGTYNIGGAITMNKAKVSLAGQGQSTILNRTFDGDAVIKVTQSNDQITNLAIAGNKATYTSSSDYGIYENGTWGLSVINTVINNTAGHSIFVGNGFGPSSDIIENNTVSNSGANGIYANQDTSSIISNNTVTGSTGTGIITGASKVTISNNYIASNSNSGLSINNYSTVTGNTIVSNTGYGIYTAVSNATISGNNISSNTSDGIALDGRFDPAYNNISDNQITSNGGNGIDLSSSAAGSAFNNTISGNFIGSNSLNGILINGIGSTQGANNNSVSANRIDNNGGSGGYSSIALTGSNASGNHFVDNTITDTAGTGYAISLGTGTSSSYLSNNTYSGTGATSIQDSGTGTIYADQQTSSGGLLNKVGIDSSTAFQVQSAGGTNYIQADTSGANLYLGNTGIASTIQVGNTTGAVAQTINIGNNSTASSTNTVTIGSLVGTSATTLQAGTGNLTLTTNSATASIIAKSQTNSSTAFQIQNSAGTSILTADTLNQQINVTNLQASGTISLQNSQGASIQLRTVSNSVPNGATTLTYSGNEMTDNTPGTIVRSGATQGDGETSPQSSTGVWESTTNLVVNGGFESNTNNWAASRDNTTSEFGAYSAKGNIWGGGTASVGASNSIPVTGGQTYTASTWAKATSGDQFFVSIYEYDSSGTFINALTTFYTATGQWQRVSNTRTLASNAAYVWLKLQDNTNNNIRWDGVQLEQKTHATPYVETNGSTATRNAARVQAPATLINNTQSWTALRLRIGALSTGAVWGWTDNTSHFNEIWYSSSNSTWHFQRYNGVNSPAVTIVNSQAAGDLVTVVAKWDSTGIYLSVNGSSFAFTADTNTYNISSSTFDIGSDTNYSSLSQSDIDILWAATGTGTLSNSDATTLYNYGNSDPTLTNLQALNSGASGATFAWDGEGPQYSSTTGSFTNNSQLSIDDVNLTHSGNGAIALQGAVNSTTAFQVQNAAGTAIFNVDTTNGIVGTAATSTSSTNSQALTIQTGNATGVTSNSGNLSIDVGTATGTAGTISIGTANSSGLTLGRSGATTIIIGNNSSSINIGTGSITGGSTSLSSLTVSGATTLNGSVLAKDTTNSATAFQIQDQNSNALFTADTSNMNIVLDGANKGALGAWSTNANALPQALQGATSVTANGYVYYIGGYAGGTGWQTTVYYAKLNADGSTGAWQTATNALPIARYYATSITANGYVYVIGGLGAGGGATSTVYYAKLNADGSTGAWQTATNALPSTYYRANSVAANGYVYLLGGIGGGVGQAAVYYAKLNADGSTGAWQTATNALPQSLYSGSTVVANGYVYYMGGLHNGASQSTVYYAQLNNDGSVGTWSSSANTLLSNYNYAAYVAANGYVYLMGGSTGTPTSSVHYAKLNSDGSIGSWQTNPNALPAAREVTTSITANGYVYVMGGDNPDSTVYYASTSRVQIGANLDLVGLQGGDNLSNPGGSPGTGSTGGSITAGDITAVGNLQVQGQGNFAQGVSVNGNLNVAGSAAFQNTTNSTTAFQIQNSAGTSILTADTTNSRIGVDVSYTAMSTPAGLSVGAATSGGSLTASATYSYKVTAIDSAGGETAASSEATGTVGTAGTQTLPVTWTAVTGASGYKVYRTAANGATGTEVYLTTVLTNSFTDTGSITAGTATPPTSTTAYTSTNNSNSSLQLSVGGLGKPTGQVYVGGTQPVKVASVPLSTTGTGSLTSSGGYLYYADSTNSTFSTYSLSNPLNPVAVGTSSNNVNYGDGDVKVVGHYAYMSQGTATIRIVDISNPASPTFVAGFTAQNGVSGLTVQGNYLYAITTGFKLFIFDISNPTSPLLKSVLSVSCNPTDIKVQGGYAYIAGASSIGLCIENVSNPSNPTEVGTINDGKAYYSIAVQGKYAYLKNGNSGISFSVFDISNPASPTRTANIADNNNSGAYDGAPMFVQGRYVYQIGPGYLEIFDVSNPYVPVLLNGTSTPISATGAFPGGTVVGRYAYIRNSTTHTIDVYDLGGAYTQQLQAGGAEVGTLAVDNNADFASNANIQGSLTVGSSLQTTGNAGIGGGLNVQGTTIIGGTSGSNFLGAPATPTVTPQGTTGSTAYSYTITAVNAYGGETTASPAGSTSSGNATLSATNYNQISWSAVTGATSYKIYRTAGGSSTGLIGTSSTTSFNDTGLVGFGSAPTTDTTGQLVVTGASLYKNTTNSTTAFQIQNSTGGSLLTADTTNMNITIDGANSGALGAWKTANTIPTALEGVATVTADGYVYVIGGNPGGCSGSASVYYAKLNNDGSVGSWNTASNSLPVAKSWEGAVAYNGYIYAIGGFGTNACGSTTTTTYYARINADGSPAAWKTASSAIPAGHATNGFVVVNGYLYAVGGYGGAAVDYAQINADGSLGTWQNTTALPVNGTYGSAVTANGYMYIVGAGTSDYYTKPNSDGSISSWTTTTGAVAQATAQIVNGYIYSIDGSAGSWNSVYYAKLNSDGSIGSWAANTNLPPTGSYYGQGSIAANGYVYVLAGHNPSSSVYYASVSRTQVAGSLDLVGLSGQNLAGPGSGTSITAGDITAVGNLQVQGQGNFAQGVSVNGNLNVAGSAAFQNTANSTTAFQIQNSSGTSLLTADTINTRIDVGTLGTTTGQLYVSGSVPTDLTSGGTATGTNPYSVAVQGRYAYVVDYGNSKLQVFDVSNPASPVDLTAGGVSTVTNPRGLYAQGHYVYVVGYTTSKLQVFDVSNPASPVDVSNGGVNTGSNPYSVYVAGRYAYVAAYNGSKLQVFDVSNPAHPADLTNGGVTTGTFPTSVYVQGRYAYVVSYSSSKLQVFDVSNPASPSDVSSGGVATLTNPWTIYVQGRYAYVAGNTKFQIFDISNPASPADVTSGGVTVGTNPRSIYVQGRYAYLAEYSANKLQVFDISSPSTPVDVSGGGATTASGPYSVFVSGRYAYVGDYGASKLQVFDLGGEYAQQLEAGGAEVGTLQVDSNGQVAGDFNVQGGLNVGQSIQAAGNLGVSGGSNFNGSVVLGGGKNQLGAPTGLTANTATSGGSLSGVYKYEVTALDAYGDETTVSNEATTATLGSPNQTEPLTWTAVTGASAYKVYRTAANGASGTEGYLATTTTNSYSDTGAVSQSTSVAPTTDSTGQLTVLGSALYKNTTNSTTAFQIQNSSGQNLFVADTSNMNVTLDGANTGALGAWQTNTNVLPTTYSGAMSVTANGYVYYIGGFTGSSTLNSVYYAKLNADGSTGSWQTNTNALPVGRSYAGSVVANGYIYVIGGLSGNGSGFNSTVYYAKLNADGSTGAWSTNSYALGCATPGCGSPAAREQATTVTANGYVYVMGGYNGSSAQSTVLYAQLNADGSTGPWSTNANALPTTNQSATSVVANGYVYEISGQTSSAVYYAQLNSDGSTGAWQTNTNALPNKRYNATSVVANGYVYVTGGAQTGSTGNTSVYYAKLNSDGSTGAWQTNTNLLPAAQYAATSITSNGYVYVMGGGGSSGSNTVYYASTSRVQIGANLDLVGLQGGDNLSNPGGNPGTGSTGGSITAGDITAVGNLQIQGQANFSQGVGITGTLSVAGPAAFQNTTNSTTAFQIQNATGSNIFNVDTTNGIVGTAATSANSTNSQAFALQTGNATGTTSNSGNLTIDAGTATGTAGTINIGTANSPTINIGAVGSTNKNTTIHIADSSAGIQTITIGSLSSSSSVIIQAGTGDITFKGHLQSTQTTAPTVSTSGCGTDTKSVVSGSTDSAGKILETTGSVTTCAVTVNFNTSYNTAPKAVLITGATTAAGVNNFWEVTNISQSSFTVTNAGSGAQLSSKALDFYYWVIE